MLSQGGHRVGGLKTACANVLGMGEYVLKDQIEAQGGQLEGTCGDKPVGEK